MSIIERAKTELAAINFGEEDSEVMISLLEQFFDQWDSGGAVSVAAPVLIRLIKGQPLRPLTGENSEWHDPIGDGRILQNIRCSTVFKDPMTGLVQDTDLPGNQPITFPYDPATQLPAAPIFTVECGGGGDSGA